MMPPKDDTPTPPKVRTDTAPRLEDPRAPAEAPRVAAPASSGDRPLGELFSELSQGVTTLLSQEIALAKAEVNQKVSRAAKDAVSLAIGGVLALGGYLALIAFLIIVLTFLVPLWISALIVTLLFLGVGYIFIQRGLSDLKRLNPVPEKTIESLQEDKEWAKEQLK
ncbi:MAG: phage holin family protein [Deinococcota bacterium]|jgi:fatty acid desaturase|nr:phage holin family protein [Deinococcota bacterium]